MQSFFLGSRKLGVLNTAYLPREDSYLLAEAVKVSPGDSVLDMGCGTGIQGLNALLKGAQKCVFTDINPIAVENARQNVSQHGLQEKAGFVESNLFENIQEKFDTIIFNSPYVTTKKIEDPGIDGGTAGRLVLDRFLAKFPEFLSTKGQCFFLQTSLNGTEKTESMLSQQKMRFEITARQKLFFEELLVFKCNK